MNLGIYLANSKKCAISFFCLYLTLEIKSCFNRGLAGYSQNALKIDLSDLPLPLAFPLTHNRFLGMFLIQRFQLVKTTLMASILHVALKYGFSAIKYGFREVSSLALRLHSEMNIPSIFRNYISCFCI